MLPKGPPLSLLLNPKVLPAVAQSRKAIITPTVCSILRPLPHISRLSSSSPSSTLVTLSSVSQTMSGAEWYLITRIEEDVAFLNGSSWWFLWLAA